MRVSKTWTQTGSKNTAEAAIGSVGHGFRSIYAEPGDEPQLCVHFSIRQKNGGPGIYIVLNADEAKTLGAALISHATAIENGEMT